MYFWFPFSTQSSQGEKSFTEMRIFIISVILYIVGFNCFAQDTTVQAKIKYYTEKSEKYLDKEKALSGFYSIDKSGIKMFASAHAKTNNKNEFFISWDDFRQFNNLKQDSSFKIYKQGKFVSNKSVKNSSPGIISGEKKLSGYRIAIDAGHIAGDMEMGEIEKKEIKFKRDSLNGLNDSISFSEGMLTFATAKLLKEKLETEGAKVFMTRTFNGGSAFGVTFDSWLNSSYKHAIDSLSKIGEITLEKKKWYLSSKCTKRDKFRLIFKDIELQKRGEIINNYNPDFTIIIHYNVDETNTGWTKPGTKDFNMTFVGGAFMKSDLSSIDKRFEFLRLLVSNDLENSIALSSAVVQSFEKTLNIKTTNSSDATYLIKSCLPANEKGVYCRNLQLTRFVHGPLVYGETLYQDNKNECVLLNKETDKTKNQRVQQVAEAYYNGILNYVNNSSSKK